MVKVYMYVTRDKYELPIAVADSEAELAQMLGVSKRTVITEVCRCKKSNWTKGRFRVVEVGEDDCS